MVVGVPKLSVQDLTVRYGGVTALDGISLDVMPNEIFGIIGPANSGKTSFLRALNRMEEFDSNMTVDGMSMRCDGRWVSCSPCRWVSR
jgi:ABC-type phosphate transport system ATPase subunit